VACILLLAVIISAMIVTEPHDEQWNVRFLGVVAILDACFSLCVPILHRLGAKEVTATEVYSHIELVCPRCGERGRYPLGKIHCPTCSLGIRVQVGE
jgi:hypothetical protein